jgi:hypothetical protein
LAETRIDAKGSAEILMQAVSEWSIGTEQFDDTTAVVADVAVPQQNRPHKRINKSGSLKALLGPVWCGPFSASPLKGLAVLLG